MPGIFVSYATCGEALVDGKPQFEDRPLMMTAGTMKQGDTPGQGGSRRALVIGASLAFIVGLVLMSIPGSGVGAVAGVVVLERLLFALPAPLAYVIGGIGLGRLFKPLFRGATDELALQVSAGLAVQLFLTHLLGYLGLFGGATGSYVAAGVVAVGCGLALHQAWRPLRIGIEFKASSVAMITALGLALLLVAACNPPGALWRSEFGAYDVLEYHLQLPQEWLLKGKLEPLAHNVYSYLPGYLEAAYLHLGAMTFPIREPVEGSAGVGLLAWEGDRLISCQLLHACFAVAAAWMTARLARRVAGERAAPVAFGLVLLTPWTIVTGSMAYNEMPLVALLAGALLAATETGTAPWKRGVLTGLLVGAAASVKPTAILFAGVPVGILLLGLSRVREWAGIVLSGCVAGLVMLAPWLWRNYEASGNPVFPFAASIFANDLGGTGAWTREQVARYMGAHRFDGSVLDRLRLLVMHDPPSIPQGPNAPSSHRGMLHPQWGMLFPMTLLACGLLLVRRGRRVLPLPLLLLAGGFLAQVVLWLAFTHLQSRFLMPLIVPCAVLTAAAVATMGERASRSLAYAAAAAPLLVQLGFSIVTFQKERASAPGQPNQMLVGGPSLRTGQYFQGAPQADVVEALGRAGPELFMNVALPPTAKVYLLGDATPLYMTRPVIYHTTYDTSPLSGVEPSQWNRVLRELGAELVLVNLAEVSRLERSGWNPPGVTADAVGAWMRQYTVPVVRPEQWGEMGVFLVRPMYDMPEAAPGLSSPQGVAPQPRGSTS